jgi:hypothetical protein
VSSIKYLSLVKTETTYRIIASAEEAKAATRDLTVKVSALGKLGK